MVEGLLSTVLDSKLDLVPQVYRHALAGGGKKVRPTLVILGARLFAGEGYSALARTGAVTRFAAATEMVHVASMIHDDVADLSTMRRGRETANAIWRNKMCVFVADFLFASVYASLSRPDYADLLKQLSITVTRMCEGEVLQAACEGNLDTTEEQYRQIIELKTASLMGASARIGAELGGASPWQAQRMAEYGLALGSAFQVADDLLDLTGDVQEMGKRPGDDLRAGRVTLPVIYAMESLSDGRVDAFRRMLISGPDLDERAFLRVVDAIDSCGAFERARRVAEGLAIRATNALDDLPHGDAREALTHLARFTVSRRS